MSRSGTEEVEFPAPSQPVDNLKEHSLSGTYLSVHTWEAVVLTPEAAVLMPPSPQTHLAQKLAAASWHLLMHSGAGSVC